MPFPMKIQPLESAVVPAENGDAAKPGLPPAAAAAAAAKSRFKRLFERQFSNMLRISSAEKLPAVAAAAAADGGGVEAGNGGGGGSDMEPSSVCLAKLVQNFMEDSSGGEKTAAAAVKCGRNRCNCFNGNCSENSDDELDLADSPFGAELLKNLVQCASVVEQNLLAEAAKIVEKNKTGKRREDFHRIVADGLVAAGYDAAVCKSRWEKSPNFPAGEHEYIDVMVEGERLLLDVNFKSEFKIARSTKSYRAVLQALPAIFVGKPECLQQVVGLVAEAAKRSLKKKGLHVPPWRKLDYMKAKWLAPHHRLAEPGKETGFIATRTFAGEFELKFAEKKMDEAAEITVVVSAWQPPAVRPKAANKGGKVVTGLASILIEKP